MIICGNYGLDLCVCRRVRRNDPIKDKLTRSLGDFSVVANAVNKDPKGLFGAGAPARHPSNTQRT